MAENKSLNILKSAFASSQMQSDLGRIRSIDIEGQRLFYVGDLSALESHLVSILKGNSPNPQVGVNKFVDLFIREMAKYENDFIFSGISLGKVSFAKRVASLGRSVVFLLHSGVKKEPLLHKLRKEIEDGYVLIISRSLSHPMVIDDDMNALWAYLTKASLVLDCHAQFNTLTGAWSSEIFKKCSMLHAQEKPMFMPPWRDEHPQSMLVLAHKYGVQQLADVEDTSIVFAPFMKGIN